MKVYFIPSVFDGCFYVRCLQQIVQNGWYGGKISLRGERDNAERQYEGAMASDVIVFQRPLQQEMLDAALILKEEGKKIVMDNDDTYTQQNGMPKVMSEMMERQLDEKIEQIDVRLKEFAKIADLVTVSTDFLANEYRHLNENVMVLPNQVDPDDWSKPKRTKGKKVRIGLVGSVAMNNDTKKIVKLLRQLGRRDDVQLVLFGLPPDTKAYEEIRKYFMYEVSYWNTFNVEWHPAVPIADYFDSLNDLELDIMLIPRDDNYFNRCKSNVKFLEASMCEIPVIAQGFEDGLSPYQVNPEDVKHMIIAHTPEEWEASVLKLIDDKKLRREMGKKAYKYVLERYNIKKNAHLWKEAYEKLLT
jgi:glycosyltransferase involved in cell wall biosynthesis